jgi:hypothetical protein
MAHAAPAGFRKPRLSVAGPGAPFKGLDLSSMQHLQRERLLLKLCKNLMENNIVYLVSPSGTGKLSLLQLFEENFSSRMTIYHCDIHNGPETAQELLERQTGITLQSNEIVWPTSPAQHPDRPMMLIVRNAHRKIDINLYRAMEVAAVVNAGKVYFIISSDLFESTEAVHLQRTDFVFSDVEAEVMLRMEEPYGLCDQLRTTAVIDRVVIECGGHARLIRAATSFLNDRFGESTFVSESDVADAIFSDAFTVSVGLCFSDFECALKGPLTGPAARTIAVLLTTRLQQEQLTEVIPAAGEHHQIKTMVALGLLVIEDGNIALASPFAARFLLRYAYPDRTTTVLPTNLRDFIIESVQLLSKSALLAATPDGVLAKEATVQHLMMAAMLRKLPLGYHLCPELGTVFSERGATRVTPCTIHGEIDFFINNVLRWGIELLVHGRGRLEHLGRFEPTTGQYTPLKMNDYIVVDFRFKDVTPEFEDRKLLTVIFEDDYDRCSIIYLEANEYVTLEVNLLP